MSHLTNDAQIKLRQAFHDQDLSINIQSDHVLVENSKEILKEKIQQIKELFDSWIDHWDCLKGGMMQPFRINLATLRTNYSY